MVAFLKQTSPQRPLTQLPYWPRKDGRLEPDPPPHCPEGGNNPCDIRIKERRDRKCGPGYRLIQFECRAHSCCFTVYPPGWGPFGRRRWASVREDGSVDQGNPKESYFSSVLDMCKGRRWSEESGSDPGTRRTQGRHINALSHLFALTSTSTAEHHLTAEILNMDTVRLRDIANGIREGPSLLVKAKGERAVLNHLTKMKDTLKPILQLGHHFGFWGPPLT